MELWKKSLTWECCHCPTQQPPRAVRGNAWRRAHWHTRGKWWWRKGWCPRDSNASKIVIHIKGILRETSWHESVKDKMLETNTNLERSMTNFQAIETSFSRIANGSHFTGWPGCAAKIKRQGSTTQGTDQCIIQGHWELTTHTTGTSGAAFTCSKECEIAQDLAPCHVSVPGSQQIPPQFTWAMQLHTPHFVME